MIWHELRYICLHAQVSDKNIMQWFVPWHYNAKVKEKVSKCVWKINFTE